MDSPGTTTIGGDPGTSAPTMMAASEFDGRSPRLRRKRAGRKLKERKTYSRVRCEQQFLPKGILANCRSIVANIEEFLNFLNSIVETVSIAAFTETWFNANIQETFSEHPGFYNIRQDRENGKRGGGILVLLNKNWINFDQIKIETTETIANVEVLQLSLRPKYLPREFKKIKLSVCYCPKKPSAEEFKNLHYQLTESTPIGELHFILGDFNGNFNIPKMKQIVDFPTREANILDLVFCNMKDEYFATSAPGIGNSDHKIVKFTSKYLPVNKRKCPVSTRTITKTDFALLDHLMEEKFEQFVTASNPEDAYNELHCQLGYLVAQCSEEKTIKNSRKFHQPWFDTEVKRAIKTREWLRNQDVAGFKQARRYCKHLIAEKKKLYYQGIIELRNSQKMWKVLKMGASLYSSNNGQKIDKEKYPKLAEHFSRFNSKEAIDEAIIAKTGNSFRVTVAQVKKTIKKQKTRRAIGLDSISMKFVKRYANLLAVPLTHIYNMILEMNTLPLMWKRAKICPIPKEKFPKDEKDYRPITIISAIPAVFESLIATQLQKLLKDSKQHAFTAKRNTETALIQLTDTITRHIDDNVDPMILLLDMSAAFDSIPHKKLVEFLLKLGNSIGVIGITIQLLLNREFVILDGVEVYQMTAGVPQGSALGPILFALYIQDIKCKNGFLVKFADDFTIEAKDKRTLQSAAQEVIKQIEEKMLIINMKKTKLVNFSRRRKKNETEFAVNNTVIEELDEVKLLGCTITSRLNWESHIGKIRSKVNSAIYHMQILKSSIDVASLQNSYYHAFILPHILYCSSLIYYSLSSAQVQSLRSLQRRALNMLPKNTRYNKVDIEDLMKSNADKTWSRMESAEMLADYQRPERLRQRTRMVFARTEIRRKQFIPAHSKLMNSQNKGMIINY